MASAFPDAVRSFTVKVTDNVSWSGSGLLLNSATSRHLFAGESLGNRNAAALLCRTDRLLLADESVVAESDLENTLPGLILKISDREYRILQASIHALGGLVRITLNSPEAVGL